MKKIAFLVAFAVLLVAAQSAFAGVKEEARKHFDRAVELVDDGQLEGALVEFQRSYDLTHHFAVLYNIGQVLVSLARPVEAFDAYQRYLADGRDTIPAARRTEVEKEMSRQKARIATLDIRGLPEGASVYVDGKETGRAPLSGPLRVGVGKHLIAATAEGYTPATADVVVAGEDYRVVSLSLAKAAVAGPLSPPAAPPMPAQVASAAPPVEIAAPLATPSKPPMSKLRIAGIVGAAVGVAGLAAGAILWSAAKGRHDDAMNALSNRPKAESLQSEAQSYATAANISLVAGGALAALGVVAIIFGTPEQTSTSSGARAYLVPSFGPGSAGLAAGGTW